MKTFIYIFLGGGMGSVARYLLQISINKSFLYSFPLSTFLINILGSMCIGMFYTLSDRYGLSPELRLFLTVGLCGGFTTFSTFSAENLSLLKNGLYITFLFYCIGSITLGIVATLLGMWLGKNF